MQGWCKTHRIAERLEDQEGYRLGKQAGTKERLEGWAAEAVLQEPPGLLAAAGTDDCNLQPSTPAFIFTQDPKSQEVVIG